jgi:hypothetical protein
MKRLKILFAASAILSLSGCYICETIATRIQIREKGPKAMALVVIEYQNISSGEADSSEVKEDFDELIQDWQGDEYLINRMDDGVYVKSRELFIHEGKLVGRETGITKQLDEIYEFSLADGERILQLEDKDFELVETNGKIRKDQDVTAIAWPADSTILYWKQRSLEFNTSESVRKNQPIMLKLFEAYLASHKKGNFGQ